LQNLSIAAEQQNNELKDEIDQQAKELDSANAFGKASASEALQKTVLSTELEAHADQLRADIRRLRCAIPHVLSTDGLVAMLALAMFPNCSAKR
jgi:hypothetical protein